MPFNTKTQFLQAETIFFIVNYTKKNVTIGRQKLKIFTKMHLRNTRIYILRFYRLFV